MGSGFCFPLCPQYSVQSLAHRRNLINNWINGCIKVPTWPYETRALLSPLSQLRAGRGEGVTRPASSGHGTGAHSAGPRPRALLCWPPLGGLGSRQAWVWSGSRFASVLRPAVSSFVNSLLLFFLDFRFCSPLFLASPRSSDLPCPLCPQLDRVTDTREPLRELLRIKAELCWRWKDASIMPRWFTSLGELGKRVNKYWKELVLFFF